MLSKSNMQLAVFVWPYVCLLFSLSIDMVSCRSLIPIPLKDCMSLQELIGIADRMQRGLEIKDRCELCPVLPSTYIIGKASTHMLSRT